MLCIDDYWQLLALHKAIMEVKFGDGGAKKELLGSPFLADVSNEIMSALVEAEREKGGEVKAARWNSWRPISENRNEWGKLIEAIVGTDRLKTLDDDEVTGIMRSIASPLELSDEQISELIKTYVRDK